MKSRIVLFILGFLCWMGLTWPPDLQHFAIGIVVALFVAYLSGDMFVRRPHIFSHPTRYLWFLYYIPVFIWECFKANIDVAYRVMHPFVPIKPGIVKIKTKLKTDTALTFLANSITLTPGTLSVDVDKEHGIIYVHWIYVETQDIEKATQLIAGRFERILERVFE